jgi:hypothetical protein
MLVRIVFLTLCVVTQTQAQVRFMPQPDDVVLARSVYGQDAASQALRQRAQAWRQQPQHLEPSLAYARAAFEQGLQSGDLRWFGNAQSALLPWWDAKALTADGFYLRGLVKQGFHQFQAGLDDINQAIALDPHQAEFWSWRFVLHLLLSRLADAQADLRRMTNLLGPDETRIYQAMFDYRTGHTQQAVRALASAAQSPRFQDLSSKEWLGFHWGEALRLNGEADKAIAVWQARLAEQPKSHGIRLTLATQLNAMGQHQQAYTTAVNGKNLELLSDALLAQAVLAAQALHRPDAPALLDVLRKRIATQARRQDGLIERPTLVYLIELGVDPARGLALSAENWQTQQDPPDAILFVKAALLSAQARAAQPVVQWVRQTGYTDPQLQALLLQLQAHPSWQSKP